MNNDTDHKKSNAQTGESGAHIGGSGTRHIFDEFSFLRLQFTPEEGERSSRLLHEILELNLKKDRTTEDEEALSSKRAERKAIIETVKERHAALIENNPSDVLEEVEALFRDIEHINKFKEAFEDQQNGERALYFSNIENPSISDFHKSVLFADEEEKRDFFFSEVEKTKICFSNFERFLKTYLHDLLNTLKALKSKERPVVPERGYLDNLIEDLIRKAALSVYKENEEFYRSKHSPAVTGLLAASGKTGKTSARGRYTSELGWAGLFKPTDPKHDKKDLIKADIIIDEYNTLQRNLSPETGRLLRYLLCVYYDIQNDGGQAVTFSMDHYAAMRGERIFPELEGLTEEEARKEKARAASAKKAFRQRVFAELKLLGKATITKEYTVSGSSAGRLNIIGSYKQIGRSEYVYVALDALFLETLSENNSAFIYVTKEALAIPGKDHNAYSIFAAMEDHYFNANNQNKGTHNLLSVKALLKYTTFPAYEDVIAAKRSWRESIQKPIEAALWRLEEKYGLLKEWRYAGKHGAEIFPDADAAITDAPHTLKDQDFNTYEDWAAANILFEPSKIPNQAGGRKQQQRERENKAIDKKGQTSRKPRRKK